MRTIGFEKFGFLLGVSMFGIKLWKYGVFVIKLRSSDLGLAIIYAEEREKKDHYCSGELFIKFIKFNLTFWIEEL